MEMQHILMPQQLLKKRILKENSSALEEILLPTRDSLLRISNKVNTPKIFIQKAPKILLVVLSSKAVRLLKPISVYYKKNSTSLYNSTSFLIFKK